jgi:cephalosporin-C deacetylase-like acetyl esterase
MRSRAALLIVGLTFANGILFAQEAVNVLENEVLSGTPAGQMMYEQLKADALEAIARRDGEFHELKTPDQVVEWQRTRREFFLKQLGGFPQRTPLNARVVGRRTFDGYRIEKVIFESQPGFMVTATLYLPAGDGPFPGVLHPTGHSANAKARDLYQLASIAIARGGCAVLCYDPIGQGERRQFLNEDNTARFSTTGEHTLINQGCVLLGSNVARYMIWDGMRAIDYLTSRDDIISDKIGCTGISGGGTNTSYLMALDERIVAAAPGCYLTGYQSLLTTIGPQDAEQNIHGQLAFGMDHADYVLMRAPQATLIMAATEDYFDIDGAWRLFRQAKRSYTRLGFPERVDLVEPDTKHGFPTEMRVAAANWMRRWLLNDSSKVAERPADVLTDKEIECTPQGQVILLEGARTVFQLNEQWNTEFAATREAAWSGDRNAALKEVARLIGWQHGTPGPRADVSVAKSMPGYSRTNVIIYSEPKIALPANLFVTQKHNGDYALLVHEEGKAADSERIAAAVHRGVIVLAVDLRGIGETRSSMPAGGFDKLVGRDWRETTLASLLNRSHVGMRTHDLVQSVRWLRGHLDDPNIAPDLLSQGHVGIPALHAIAVAPEYFGKADIRGSVSSWSEVVSSPLESHQQSNLVFGALRHYDLTDLVRAIPADRLIFEPTASP